MPQTSLKTKETVIGVDCGGTNIKMALVSRSGDLIASSLDPIDFEESPERVISRIALRIKNFRMAHEKKHGVQVQGVGMGIAGDLDPKEGSVRFSPNLNWRNVPLKKILERELKIPIVIDNDANCAAWGAYCLDAKRNCDHLICLTLGTGIGGGIILNKKMYRGSSGSAGEIGHMTIRYDGRPCKCGNFGCLESTVGAWGLIQTAQEGMKRAQAKVLSRILSGPPPKKLNPETIALAARKGDSCCQQIWRDAGEMLGSGLANLVNIFNPDRILLCGGVSKVGALLLEPALHTLGSRAFPSAAKRVHVSVSKFDERLGVVGAGLLFWE